MPRFYKCKACGLTHGPPTGKHCPNRDDIQQPQPDNTNAALMPILLEIRQRMDAIEVRQNTETASTSTIVADGDDSPTERPEGSEEELMEGDDTEDDVASPETLRKNKPLMNRAAARLDRMRRSLRDDDDTDNERTAKAKGKRSGSVMTATDIVVKKIDWPHMYVRRLTGGRRKPVSYSDLKVEEFVFGFLTMLQAPRCKLHFPTMMRILQNIMQDAMDFSWPGARTLYESVGVDVEMGMLEWTDEVIIDKMRADFARTFVAPKKEVRELQQKPPLQPAPPGMKCCLPYQRHACEHNKDHASFVHACAYCQKSKSVLCRHPENDCYRKISDQAKNGKQREANSSLPQ